MEFEGEALVMRFDFLLRSGLFAGLVYFSDTKCRVTDV